MKNKKIIAIVAVCAAAAVALGAAFHVSNQQKKAAAEEAPAVIGVQTLTPSAGTIENEMEFIGNLSSGSSVAVVPSLTAKVLSVNVKAGDEVKAGDLLFTLDTSDLQSQVDMAKIALDSAQLSYELTTGTTLPMQEDSAYLQYDAARDAYHDAEDAYDDLVKGKKEKVAAMKAEIERTQGELAAFTEANWPGCGADEALVQAGAAAKQTAAAWQAAGSPAEGPEKEAMDAAAENLSQLQSLKGAAETAKGSLASYETAVDRASAGVDAAESGYNAAKIAHDAVSGDSREKQEELAGMQLKQAQVNYNKVIDLLNDARVTAPVDGTVLSVGVQENNYLSPAAPAMVLGSGDAMKVVFGLPSNYFGTPALGQTVTVEASGRAAEGVITEIAPMLNPQTCTFTVTAEFPGDGTYLPGSPAKVTLVTERADNVMTLPMDCVRFEHNEPYVYVVRDGIAVRTALTLGVTDENVYEVKNGLSFGDEVISTWHPGLTDGAAVEVR